MLKFEYFRFLNLVDEAFGLLAAGFIVFATVRLCIRLPYSPLFSIAIQVGLTLISYCLINFNRIIFYVNKFIIFSYKTKGTVYTANVINERRKRLVSRNISLVLDPESSLDESLEVERKNVASEALNVESSHESSLSKTAYPSFGIRQYSFLRSLSVRSDRRLYRYGSDEMHYRHRSYSTTAVPPFTTKIRVPEELAHDSRIIRFFKRLQIWLKLHFVKRVLISKIWVVSTLLVTLSWFAVWEWAALFMTREDGDYDILHWNMEHVPHEYWYLESSFQIIFAFTYILNLYESSSRLKYIFSFYGLIDLTMTPVITEIISIVSHRYLDVESVYNNSIQNFGLLLFGSLRFLRLFQTESLISKSFTWISEFYTVFIGIAASILALVFSFSGLLFLLEAPRHDIKFSTPFDFIFFGVATIATVGYGDFSPVTLYGRLLCIMFIILCVTVGATQFKRLKLSVSDNTHKMGSGKFSEGYVFFWGSISDWQLLTFCKCIHNTYERLITNVVVATPLPLKYYETVHMAVTQNTRIKLVIFGGSSTLNDPSYISKLLFNSNYTVLVNDMDVNLLPNFNEYVINDDRKTILMALASINISMPLGIPLSIQLHGSEYKTLMKNLDMDNVFCNRDMKYKMFAKSVACRGLFYLISSLFHSPTNIERTKIHVEEMCNLFLMSEKMHVDQKEIDEASEMTSQKVEISIYNVQNQMDELFRGMKFQIFRLKFPKAAYGISFHKLASYLYTHKNMFLIGIVSQNNKCVLNPVQYTVGDESAEKYDGLVIAESLNDVIKLSIAKFNTDDQNTYELSAFSPMKKARSSIFLAAIAEVGNDSENTKYRGVYKVPSYQYAISNVLDESPIVLLCGWPYDLKLFLRYLLFDRHVNVVILAPMESVEEEDPASLDEFVSRVVYIDGSPMETKALLNSGIVQAECVIVFNFHHTEDKGRRSNLSRDSQVLFVHRLALEATGRRENERALHVILDVSHASCLEYLDPSLIVNVEVTSKNYAQNKCWENYGEFMSSYEIASGCIFVQDMFYSILAHSNTKSEYSVSHESIESMLEGGTLKTSSYTLRGGVIQLEPVAMSFYGKNFEKIFKYYFNVEYKICVGILRRYVVPFVNEELKKFIVVAPQPYLIIQPNDRVYVITRSELV